jgi:hypothetical protein
MELDPAALNELRDSCQGRNVDVRVTPQHLLDILPNH